MVSRLRGVGGGVCVVYRVMLCCVWVSEKPVVYMVFQWDECGYVRGGDVSETLVLA